MPFPVSVRGSFEYRSVGEANTAASAVADRVERALIAVDAQDVERFGNTIHFAGTPLFPDATGPFAAWTAPRSSALWVVAQGKVEITPAAPTGGAGSVRYYLRTTRGVGGILLLMTGVEILARVIGPAVPPYPIPPFLFPGLIGTIWAIHYVLAWIRVPLLLVRAADAEPRHQAARAGSPGHRDAAT